MREVNFHSIFVGRKRHEIPEALKVMMDAVKGKKIISLDLSSNAFGPQGIESFENFLESAKHLERLDISNCGLSPKGGEMIAAALLKCKDMKLRHFAATRSRLEEEGIAALSEVFVNQKSIETIDLAQNGSKRALSALFKAMEVCSNTLTELSINDNKSIKKSIPQLIDCIKACQKLKVLNISDLSMK